MATPSEENGRAGHRGFRASGRPDQPRGAPQNPLTRSLRGLGKTPVEPGQQEHEREQGHEPDDASLVAVFNIGDVASDGSIHEHDVGDNYAQPSETARPQAAPEYGPQANQDKRNGHRAILYRTEKFLIKPTLRLPAAKILAGLAGQRSSATVQDPS